MNPAERLWNALVTRDWAAARSQFEAHATIEWPHAGRDMDPDTYLAALRSRLAGGPVEVRRTTGCGRLFAVEATAGGSHCAGFYDVHQGLIHEATEYWVGGAVTGAG
jgi:hypothetical protein